MSIRGFFTKTPKPAVRTDSKRDCAILSRLDRSDENAWQSTRSCLGGIPPADLKRWPNAMHCVAQIDLDELSQVVPMPHGHTSGRLIFFYNFSTGHEQSQNLVQFAEGSTDELTDLPRYMQPVYGVNWNSGIKGIASQKFAPRSLRRWPVRITRASQFWDAAEDYAPPLRDIMPEARGYSSLDWADLVPGHWKTTERPPRREMRRVGNKTEEVEIPATTTKRFVPDKDISQHLGHVAVHILNDIAAAVGQKLASGFSYPKAQMADAVFGEWHDSLQTAAEIMQTIDDLNGVLAKTDLDKPIGEAVGGAFVQALDTLCGDLKTIGLSGGRIYSEASTILTAADKVYTRLFSGTRAEYDMIPPPVRDRIQSTRMASGVSRCPHQMMGFGSNIQEAAFVNRHRHLLLQITSDDLVDLMWGDCGVLQYWIDEEHLKAGAWHMATATVESG